MTLDHDLVARTNTRYHRDFHYWRNDTVIGASLGMLGEYAQAEIDFVSQFMDAGSCVYDIGANIGVHACAWAHTGAEVWAWEASPRQFELLTINTQDLDRVHGHNQAVGAAQGLTWIQDFDPREPGNYGHLRTGLLGQEVRQVALDTVTAPDPDIIKIDVEGQELDVLRGAQHRIARNQPMIVVEVQENRDLAEMYHWLVSRGYDVWWLPVPNYRWPNWRQCRDNPWLNSMIFSWVARPPGWPCLPLDPVQGPNDTVVRCVQRLNLGRHRDS